MLKSRNGLLWAQWEILGWKKVDTGGDIRQEDQRGLGRRSGRKESTR